ncbi:hypothetical protein F2Q70_00034595 [Brassica cretica]|uniref:CCHC-type domain-containing protein n=1 Tax=Brassica cretica TaxID=69181 RepID=A0A8S9JXV1_BRACR|nr:hypothetical protein F2Q70_00034595 [Brassica cretica]
MQNVWQVPGHVSGRNPPSVAAGEHPDPPPVPPDPPDPSSPLSPQNFPPLKTPPTSSKPFSAPLSFTAVASKVLAPTGSHRPARQIFGSINIVPEIGSENTPKSGSTTNTIHHQPLTPTDPNLKILPPKNQSPLPTNLASSSQATMPPITNPQEICHPPTKPLTPQTQPIIPSEQTSPTLNSHVPSSTLVERLCVSEDKTLRRLAPVTVAPSGRPRILIHDSVFQKGAELHKDFIVCYFNGKPLLFNQIQSVFNHMLGKGKRLEIHNNPLNRSTLVRIQSEYLRQKIIERIFGLVGDPKEIDEFTKNLVSLTLSHVKVEVDLTKPLPPVVEFERQSGEVVEVLVHYPWVPPTCFHCHEMGHIIRNCLSYTPPEHVKEMVKDPERGKQSVKDLERGKQSVNDPEEIPAC